MSISNTNPQPKDVVILQRDDSNVVYGETHISGSNLIIYVDSDGHLNADMSASFYNLFPPVGGATETASYVPFQGNRPIKRSGYVGLNAGGLDVVTFLDNFFFPFITASIGIDGGLTYYESGSSQNVLVNGTITPDDETVFSISVILKDSFVWNTFDPNISLNYSFTDTGTTTGHVYQTFVPTGNNGTPITCSSVTKTTQFIFPFFYGTTASPGILGSTLYSSLNKDITPQSNKSYTLSATAQYIYIAYPAVYPTLSHIYDPNSLDIITSFNVYSGSVSSLGLTNNWSQSYRVYQLETLADPLGIYQFDF